MSWLAQLVLNNMLASLDNVYCIILAAGNSSRLGKPKQLLVWQGITLLEHAIQTVGLLLGSRIIVVVGANADAMHSAVELNQVTTVNNPNWQEGIASSIRIGIVALPLDSRAVLIMLCDQPLISTYHIKSLLEALQKQPEFIIASSYNETVGVPAIFPSAFLSELRTLKGDTGAKSLFSKYPDKLVTVPVPEATLDIDTVADYNQLTNRISYAE
jgi:molybdenum cofactor cytidylyltransferase